MKRRNPDLEKLRIGLQRMDRGRLLTVAERAIEMVPKVRLGALIGDMIRLEEIAEGKPGATPLLAEVTKFRSECLSGAYYESFNVNSKNFMEKSEGTDAFIAEFDRLLTKCVRAAAKGPLAPVREAFELLFALLRLLDEGDNDVVFFADEGGSWQVGVDWRTALPAYFRCLADGAPPEEFAREVDRTIKDFADYERPRHVAAARRVASSGQKTALRRLPARKGGR